MSSINVESVTPILNVSDVVASLHWFESLGWRRGFTWNDGGMIFHAADSDHAGPARFASVCSGEHAQIFMCKDGQGSRDPRPCPNPAEENYGGVWMSWWVPDVDAAHAVCVAAKVEVIRPPANMPWGVREFLIRHPDGHYFRMSGAAQ